MQGIGTILFGRRTYEMFEGFWPRALDGSDTSSGSGSAALPDGVLTWTGAPVDGANQWVLDRKGRVWRLVDGENWQLVPVSTEGAFRGLSSGR